MIKLTNCFAFTNFDVIPPIQNYWLSCGIRRHNTGLVQMPAVMLCRGCESVYQIVAPSAPCTPQTVMLGGIPPSIQHDRRLWARNLPLPLMIGEQGWGVLISIDIEERAWICLLWNQNLWRGRMTEYDVSRIKGWCWVESFQKEGGCWVETVWGSKKSTKIFKLGNVCKQHILHQQREQKSGCVVYPSGYISAHKVLVWIFANVTIDSKIFNWYKKPKERCKDTYALTLTMDLWYSRRSDQKDYNIFFIHMTYCRCRFRYFWDIGSFSAWTSWLAPERKGN